MSINIKNKVIMKTNRWFLLLVMILITGSATAQGNDFDDDIYSSSKSRKTVQSDATAKGQTTAVTTSKPQRQVTVETVLAGERDVDEYNRRYSDSGEYSDEPVAADGNTAGEYADSELTERIVRFHNPEKIIVSGADNLNVAYNGEDYELNFNEPENSSVNIYVNNYGGGGGLYDPWYAGYGWYRPYYYSGWYSPWYGGWYSPWYYHSWYSPWYGGYYGGYWGGYYGGGWHHHHRPYYTSNYYNGRRGYYSGGGNRSVNSRVSGDGRRSSSVSRGQYTTSRSSSGRVSRDNATTVNRGSSGSREGITSSSRSNSGSAVNGQTTSRSRSDNGSSGSSGSRTRVSPSQNSGSSSSGRSSSSYDSGGSSSSRSSSSYSSGSSSRSSSSYSGGGSSRSSGGGFSGGGGGGGRSSGGGGRR
jgi:hypothetical protein